VIHRLILLIDVTDKWIRALILHKPYSTVLEGQHLRMRCQIKAHRPTRNSSVNRRAVGTRIRSRTMWSHIRSSDDCRRLCARPLRLDIDYLLLPDKWPYYL